MGTIEESQARLCSKIVVLSPALVAQRLDEALDRFLLDYSHIPRAEAIAMWKAAGG